jgi:hypothetical protein
MIGKYSTEARWVLIGVIVGIAIVALLSAPVSAQTDSPVDVPDNSTEDDSDASNETDEAANETDELRPNKYQQTIDPSARLIRADWGEENLTVFIESDIPGRSITVSDGAMIARIIESGDGSGSAPSYGYTLDKGVNEIVIPIERSNGLGLIFIAPPDPENTIYVKEDRSTNWFDGQFSPGEARLMVTVAAAMGSVGMVGFVWWRRKKLAKTVKQV